MVETSSSNTSHVSESVSNDFVVQIAPEILAEKDVSPASSPLVKLRKSARTDSSSGKRRNSKLRYFSFIDICRDHIEYALARWSKEKMILKANWRTIAIGLVFQYIHKVATNVVYYLHVPRQPLRDMGFELFPALSRDMQILSEVLFFMLFISTIVFMISPFCMRSRAHLYSSIMFTRFLGVCFFAQLLRCCTFLVTILPGPNYHCRPQSPDYNPPREWGDFFYRADAFYGCGDLVFSSHTIFVLLCTLTYTKFADGVWIKRRMWVLVGVFGMLVVSARKHYSVDIIVAWYTVPLLWVAYERFFPEKIPQDLLLEMQKNGEPIPEDAATKKDMK